jgi:hypothetical protein
LNRFQITPHQKGDVVVQGQPGTVVATDRAGSDHRNFSDLILRISHCPVDTIFDLAAQPS